MLGQLTQYLVQIQPKLRQPLLRNLDEHLFILHTKQLNFGHMRHAQQLLTHVVGEGFDFSVVETVRLQRVNHAVDIAKIIIEKRPLNARGQRAANVANLLADGVPGVGHVRALDDVFDLKNDL